VSGASTADPDSTTEPVSLRVARLYAGRCRAVPVWVGLLALLEDYARTWDDPACMPRRRHRKIYERDGYRCMAPGCTARCCNDDHHVHYRSHGGKDGFENEVCLCRFHHQQGEHGRYARVRGRAPLDLVFRLGTPEAGEWNRNERKIDVRAA